MAVPLRKAAKPSISTEVMIKTTDAMPTRGKIEWFSIREELKAGGHAVHQPGSRAAAPFAPLLRDFHIRDGSVAMSTAA